MGNWRTQFESIPIEEVPEEALPLGCRIVSVSYDPSLARTRALMLSASGCEVFTFMDVEQAAEACKSEKFDLVIIGHSIPRPESLELARMVRRECGIPVLALQRHGEAAFQDADYHCDPAEPAALVEKVRSILRRKLLRSWRKGCASNGQEQKAARKH